MTDQCESGRRTGVDLVPDGPSHGDQPLPVAGQQNVTDALVAFLRQRERKGIQTYGRSLQTWNGRDAVRDLIEKLLDGAQYAMQWEMERAALLGQIERLTAECEQLRSALRQHAQRVHQGYHVDIPGTWEECPRGVCASTRVVLAKEPNR